MTIILLRATAVECDHRVPLAVQFCPECALAERQALRVRLLPPECEHGIRLTEACGRCASHLRWAAIMTALFLFADIAFLLILLDAAGWLP